MEKNRERSPIGFSVGTVLGRSMHVWLRNCIPFAALLFVLHVPLLFYAALSSVLTSADPEASVTEPLIFEILSYAPALLILWMSAVLMYRVFEQLEGNRPRIGKCAEVGFRRFFPVLGVAGIVALAISLPLLFGIVMASSLSWLALVASAVILCAVFVAVPAAVMERPGLLGAIRRSIALTRGHKRTIFLVLTTIGVLLFLTALFLEYAEGRMSDESGMSFVLALMVLGLLVGLGGFIVTTSAVVYHDLRLLKEGVGVEELKDVFA